MCDREQERIHALLDDASRYVIALEARHTERAADMMDLLLAALRRHGAPDGLYLDNGSTCRSDGLRLCCERLDITLVHARPGDAPARGTMERFWRSLRAGCLHHLGTLTSLHAVQVRLGAFLDEHWAPAPRHPSRRLRALRRATHARRVRTRRTLSAAAQLS